jgi:hypothetical protein
VHALEREAIGLSVCIDALNGIVNYLLAEPREVSSCPGEYEVYFKDYAHKYLFLVRALDFVKENGDADLTGVKGSCLDVLRQACSTASFDRKGSIDALSVAVKELDDWLNYRSPMIFWLPDLDINANLNVSRLELLHISGNYSKHNLSRLTRVSKTFHKILKTNGYEVELESIPFAIDYFCEHLNENYFIYYCTWITELLNNLRWAIYDYLHPMFLETSVRKSEFHHTYDFPIEIDSETAKKWYWGMMNGVLTEPVFPRFKAAYYLKEQSSLEWIDELDGT